MSETYFEASLAALHDCLNLALREAGLGEHQTETWTDDMRPGINALLDKITSMSQRNQVQQRHCVVPQGLSMSDWLDEIEDVEELRRIARLYHESEGRLDQALRDQITLTQKIEDGFEETWAHNWPDGDTVGLIRTAMKRLAEGADCIRNLSRLEETSRAHIDLLQRIYDSDPSDGSLANNLLEALGRDPRSHQATPALDLIKATLAKARAHERERLVRDQQCARESAKPAAGRSVEE